MIFAIEDHIEWCYSLKLFFVCITGTRMPNYNDIAVWFGHALGKKKILCVLPEECLMALFIYVNCSEMSGMKLPHLPRPSFFITSQWTGTSKSKEVNP